MFIRMLLPGLVLGLAAGLAACSQPPSREAPAEPEASPPPLVDSFDAGLAAPKDSQRKMQREAESLAGQGAVASESRAVQDAMKSYSHAPAPIMVAPPPPASTERYAHFQSHELQRVAENPVSTFSVDVDTGAYANVRRFLEQAQLPPRDAVRVEELINYFDYAYTAPRDPGRPFGVITSIAPTPWNPKTHLLHVGIQGWKPEVKPSASNLVFLVDVSGSMQDQDKLPLVKSSLKMLTRRLGRNDRIALVVYAGASGVVLPSTSGDRKAEIDGAIDRLEAGGSTNGGAGIELAYAMAREGYIENGVNRVLLATDGDFNVGVTDFNQLLDIVKTRRKSGVALTTLGFGTGNYNDELMEQLADAGDGNHAYVDSLSEAQKVLVRQREATLNTIARDVKIQIEFNPAAVAEYRLIGYENRALQREDFANDAVDAGDIGAGHTVTALYEIALTGSEGVRVEPLRYGKDDKRIAPALNELAHLRLRYKRPEDGMDAQSRLIERAIQRADVGTSLERSSPALRFSAAVAGFGQLLRGSKYTESFDYTDVAELASGAKLADPHGDVGEFVKLVRLAEELSRAEARVRQDVRIGG